MKKSKELKESKELFPREGCAGVLRQVCMSGSFHSAGLVGSHHVLVPVQDRAHTRTLTSSPHTLHTITVPVTLVFTQLYPLPKRLMVLIIIFMTSVAANIAMNMIIIAGCHGVCRK